MTTAVVRIHIHVQYTCYYTDGIAMQVYSRMYPMPTISGISVGKRTELGK